MSLRWRKLGLLYTLPEQGLHNKLHSHVANPLPLFLEGDKYRVYYSSRDTQNRSSIGAVDIDITKRKVIKEYANPFFIHGPKDSFYADGVSIGNCYKVDGTRYMLFMGWRNPPGEHWRGEIGRLIVNADYSLDLESDIPLIGLEKSDPLSLSYPWVQRMDSNEYRMWYGSTLDWDAGNEEMLHVINSATSADGHTWKRQGLAVPYQKNQAQAFSRPTVVNSNGDGYQMWFSYRSGRGESYRIGYAESSDAMNWKLMLDKVGIEMSSTGWDSNMIEYPFVFDHNHQRYMLYNGNDYGKTGFGLAILESGDSGDGEMTIHI